MAGLPRISIVTPSYNQARYIGDTVESVLAQEYPDVEHIVMDGASRDGALEVLARYPHLRVVSEPDRGHADAVNKGFRLATGEIFAFLNSDDTLAPGALHRVAREIDPARGRHVVMGRCRFIDESGRFVGIEHPSHFESHRRVLEVWKGHTIPQPAVFWTPEVWRACGPLDESLETAWIDYDLFCRFSRRFRFHAVDQVLANYRLHPESKTESLSEAARLEESIQLSRRHWGSPLAPLYWQVALSLARYRFDRRGRARAWLRRARERYRRGGRLGALAPAAVGAAMAPEVAFFAGAYPFLRTRASGAWKRALDRLAPRGVSPQTAAYLDRAEAWADGWVGPRLVLIREASGRADAIALSGWVDLSYIGKPQVFTLSVDGQPVGRHRVDRTGDVAAEIPIGGGVAAGAHTVEIRASEWFVSHDVKGNGDHRPLSWRVGEVEFRDRSRAPAGVNPGPA